MGKIVKKSDHRVMVFPKALGHFGCVRVSDRLVSNDPDRDYIARCEQIVADIKRHVDDVGWVGVVSDVEDVCEFCGSSWSEGDSPHNGGCCRRDIEIMESYEAPAPAEKAE